MKYTFNASSIGRILLGIAEEELTPDQITEQLDRISKTSTPNDQIVIMDKLKLGARILNDVVENEAIRLKNEAFEKLEKDGNTSDREIDIMYTRKEVMDKLDISSTTFTNYKQKEVGGLKTKIIFGKIYVSKEDFDEFVKTHNK